MIRKKVMAVENRHESKASTHVIIDWDRRGPNPLVDYDHVFLVHSNIPSELCGNENDRGYDEETKTFRPAKDEAEFRKYLWELAKSELELFQKYMDGECFGWREETRVPFKRVYPDGREIDDCEWEDGDSCWGYYVDSINDFEFPKNADTDVFDATGRFVGDEWTLPEFVVRSPVSGLYLMTESSKDSDSEWVHDLSKAKVFNCRNAAYNAFLQRGKRLWEIQEYARNGGRDAIRDKDELK